MQITRPEAAAYILEKSRDSIRKKGGCVIAIDGNSGAGKSTFAMRLAAASGAALFHMDDFFLPPELRTPERLEKPGGNIHSERFLEEIIQGISSGKDFIYHVFSCNDFSYTEKKAFYAPVNIIEGVYSMHPAWQDRLDLKVFMQIAPEVQQERILHRNGEEMLKKFTDRWIPMENRYFDFCKIREICDCIVV
ncbi:MAG: uridine kinase [Clostridia bacterium]